jgi:hypothetical protein
MKPIIKPCFAPIHNLSKTKVHIPEQDLLILLLAINNIQQKSPERQRNGEEILRKIHVVEYFTRTLILLMFSTG